MLVREARPEDVEAAVPLIHSAGPDAFNYVFSVPAGPSTADFLRAAFLSGDGQFGWRNHAVAEHDGEVVGIAAAWGADSTLRFSLAALRQLVRVYGWVPAWAVAIRALRTQSVIPPPLPGCLYIADLGVAPSCRGQGIGRALIDWLGERGRGRYPTLALCCCEQSTCPGLVRASWILPDSGAPLPPEQCTRFRARIALHGAAEYLRPHRCHLT